MKKDKMKLKRIRNGMDQFRKTFEDVQRPLLRRKIRQKELELNSQELEKTLQKRQDALYYCKVKVGEILLPIEANRLFILVDNPKVSEKRIKDIRSNPRYSDVKIVVLKKTKKNVKSIFNPVINSIKENIDNIKKELKQVE